jgi:hypothetical protein
MWGQTGHSQVFFRVAGEKKPGYVPSVPGFPRPQRFAQTLGAVYCTVAIELTPGYHQVLTRLWQGVLPYGGTYTAAQIFAAAEEVYWGFPNMAEAARECAALAGL